MTKTASDFKAHCLQYLDDVKRTGQAIQITKRGKNVARLVAADAEVVPKPWEYLQSLPAKLQDDLIAPVVDAKDWQAPH